MLAQWEQVSIPRGSKRVAGFTILGVCLRDFLTTLRYKRLHIAIFRGFVIGPIYGTLPACFALVALRAVYEIRRAQNVGAGLRVFARLLARRTAQAWVVLEILFYCYFKLQKKQLSRRRHLPAGVVSHGGQRRALLENAFRQLAIVVDPSVVKSQSPKLVHMRRLSKMSQDPMLSSSNSIVDMATQQQSTKQSEKHRMRRGLHRFGSEQLLFKKVGSADQLLNKSVQGAVSMERLFRSEEVSGLIRKKHAEAFLALKQAEIRSWFFEAPLEKIRQENLEDWVLEYFFNGSDKLQLSKADLEDLAWSVEYIVSWLGLSLEPGRSSDVYCVRLSRDELPAVHRPLWIYAATQLALPKIEELLLKWHGFRKYCSGSLQYWHRPKQKKTACEVQLQGLTQGSFAKGAIVRQNSSGAVGKVRSTTQGSEVTIIVDTGNFSVDGGAVDVDGVEVGTPSKVVPLNVSAPIVFCHGLGIGILPYVQFILELGRAGTELFLIILPHIAMHMKDDVQSGSEVAVCALDMLSAWGHSKAHFVGHSFGTIFCAWVMKQKPQLVVSVSLIDPVCFLMMKADLLVNALYKDHSRFIQYMLQICVFQELFICHTLMRNIFWWDCNIDPSEIVAPCFVLLAGCDDIVPAHSVRRLLEAESALREFTASGATRVQQSGSPSARPTNECLATVPLEITWKDSWIHFQFCATDSRRRQVADSVLSIAHRSEDLPHSIEEW